MCVVPFGSRLTMCVVDVLSEEADRCRFRSVPIAIVAGSLFE